jgi:NADH:ubiquinone oxidoreductase subunit F (NADH-binding)
VQIGGPSGGCVPEWKADTPIDFESLKEVGAMMGSGGLVVLDDTDCMVDIARYFLTFTQNESCGKCSFGRIGTKRMLEILEKITAWKGNGTGPGKPGKPGRVDPERKPVCPLRHGTQSHPVHPEVFQGGI